MKMYSIGEAVEMWGGLLWKKEEYYRLLPHDEEWKKLVDEKVDEVNERKKSGRAYSPKPFQAMLYTYYRNHSDKPLPESYFYLRCKYKDKSMQEVSDMVKKGYLED